MVAIRGASYGGWRLAGRGGRVRPIFDALASGGVTIRNSFALTPPGFEITDRHAAGDARVDPVTLGGGGGASRRRDCHSAAPPSTVSRRINSDVERASSK